VWLEQRLTEQRALQKIIAVLSEPEFARNHDQAVAAPAPPPAPPASKRAFEMPRGDADNLRAAAQRKHQAAIARATIALDALERDGTPVTFRGPAKTAGVSVDLLYRSPVRARIEQRRADQQRTPPTPREPEAGQPPSHSNVIRALTAQLAELRRHHRDELARLEAALAAAQGENLELRRRLGRFAVAPAPADLADPEGDAGELIETTPPARRAAG
jgi:hypothetical protein